MINYPSITQEAIDEICKMPLSHPCGFFNRAPVQYDMSPEMIRARLLGRVWGKSLALLRTQYEMTEPASYENLISAILQEKAFTGVISCRKDSSRLNLKNSRYRIYKLGKPERAFATPWPAEERYEILLPVRVFSHFVLQFDEMVPELVSHIPEIGEIIRKRQLEENLTRIV